MTSTKPWEITKTVERKQINKKYIGKKNLQMENRRSQELPAPVHSTTHLDFKQAMQDFQTMFPDMDLVVIEEVLRANQGEVDATIDQLLSMTTDNVNEALRLHLEKEENKDNSPRHNKDFPNYPDVAKSSFQSKSQSKKWDPPLVRPLPHTFLRISSSPQVNMWRELLLALRKLRSKRWCTRHQPKSRRVGVREKPVPDCGEDERIVLFLQNEEFLSELRVNPEFLRTLDQDGGGKSGGNGESGGGGGVGPDVEAFKERLRNMGKISRNKFAQLAKVFQRRKKNRSGKGILEQSGAGDSMFWGAEPLLSENPDDSGAATSTATATVTTTAVQKDAFSK